MKYKVEIDIMPRKEILDPQGKAVALGLEHLGITNISDVRIGKHVSLIIEASDEDEAKEAVEEACKNLLANVIMETYTFKIKPHKKIGS